MNIDYQINAALAKANIITGKAPTKIYLGRKQIKELMQLAQENKYILGMKKDGEVGAHRYAFMGCLIYEVNDEDHCAAI